MAEEQLAGLMVAGHRLTPDVAASLQEASAATGVNFNFLVAQATVESGLRNVQARHSSAAGLFQFTTQTWLRMIRAHGAQYGLGDLASEITTLGNGHLAVSDPASEQKILDLREDVKLSAIMAGELAKENGHALEKALHRKANPAELHLAHLLGATGAIRVLRARAADPSQSAAALTPQAAKQNPQLFYERGSNHTPVTVAGLYGKIKTSIETPLKQLAAAERPAATDGLRPGPGLSDGVPKRRA